MRQAADSAFTDRMNGRGRARGELYAVDAGFTLLELIAVLAVVAIIIVALRPTARRPPVGLAPVASQVITNLRAAREAAISNDQPVALLIEREGTAYRFTGARTGVPLPQGMRISYQGTDGFQRAGLGEVLEFFVDGTSTGGAVILRDGRGAVAMRVEVLSGTVTMEKGP